MYFYLELFRVKRNTCALRKIFFIFFESHSLLFDVYSSKMSFQFHYTQLEKKWWDLMESLDNKSFSRFHIFVVDRYHDHRWDRWHVIFMSTDSWNDNGKTSYRMTSVVINIISNWRDSFIETVGIFSFLILDFIVYLMISDFVDNRSDSATSDHDAISWRSDDLLSWSESSHSNSNAWKVVYEVDEYSGYSFFCKVKDDHSIVIFECERIHRR